MNVDKNLEQIYQEGVLDRLKARTAGVVGGAGAMAGNVGRAVSSLGGGSVIKQTDVSAAANQSKLDSIVKTFQKELSLLFGKDWTTKYPSLSKELSNLRTPPDKNKPLKQNQIVTGAGKYKGKYKVVTPDVKGTVMVVKLDNKGNPMKGNPIPLNRQTDILESKKITLDQAYDALSNVTKL